MDFDKMTEDEMREMLKKLDKDSEGMSADEMRAMLKDMAGDPDMKEKMQAMKTVADAPVLHDDKEHAPAPIEVTVTAIKAVGDWEIEVCAIPFGMDRDGQTFDGQTDYMLSAFPSPVITYHHGIEPGQKAIQKIPVIIGKTTGVEKRQDGIWIRVLLDKTLDFARRVWEAAKKGLAVASSDSIAHLARLEVNGKKIFYEKDRPGRIAVWPLAGVSLWDTTPGNFRPASPNAIALPAMKAIYREAGLPFPDFNPHDVLPEAEKSAGKRAREQALAYLITIPNEE